ncbi:MAG TPA: hypothetical protein VL484_04460 [Vicinamibacterales bacterium]|jgi:hypothetical protein|nr:hypothetical protein [Vicinamibacterales bacterium]
MFPPDWNLVARIRALFDAWRPAEPPVDPLAPVREPKWRDPGGRSSAIAVPEPEPDEFVLAGAGRRK